MCVARWIGGWANKCMWVNTRDLYTVCVSVGVCVGVGMCVAVDVVVTVSVCNPAPTFELSLRLLGNVQFGGQTDRQTDRQTGTLL